MNRHERIAEQLGMSHGAANNKLRKAILYSYVKRLREHFCYKCGAEIESSDDFSVEHKQPWEGRDSALFWELDNIAFSHLRCNRPHVNRGGENKKVGPEGTAWCSSCKIFKNVSNFAKQSDRWNGYHGHCRSCATINKRNLRMKR